MTTEKTRGRDAGAPEDIPARGWRDIFWRIWEDLGRDNVSIVAAGVAFYGMLAVFPAISVLVSLYGVFADSADVEAHFATLKGVILEDAWQLLNNQLTSVTEAADNQLGIGAAVGLVIAVWSAGAGVRALMTALNIAYHESEKRSLFTFYGTAFLFTIGIVLVGLFSLGVVVAVPAVLNLIQLGALTKVIVTLFPWVVLAIVIMTMLALLYRHGASRENPKTRWVSWGAVAATLLWIVASLGFSFYVSNFASYNETYGSLGAVVILLMWFWISAYIVLLGAEMNAEMEHQTERDTTSGPSRPQGKRGAYVADHIGEAAS
jgi:membrane protein